MHLLGIETIRGSTTRGGARALLKMLRAVKDENRHLALTPDGPKGPREVVQKGTVQLAIKTGVPVVSSLLRNQLELANQLMGSLLYPPALQSRRLCDG